MWRKLLPIVVILLSGLSSASASDADTIWPAYSVQTRAVRFEQLELGLERLERLRDKGYLAYAYRRNIDGEQWLYISVGAFETRDAAEAFGPSFAAAEGLNYTISQSPVRILRASGGRDFVVTPTALWVRGAIGVREVFAFDAEGPYWAGLPDVILARVSPDRSALVFLYNHRFYKAGVDGSEVIALTNGHMPDVVAGGDFEWQPGWSPSGRYVAFLDQAFLDGAVGLWAARVDGVSVRCLACDRNGREAVRWFVWHPTEDRVLFISGYGFGTVAMGGTLYSADMDGNVQPVAAAALGPREEIVGPLRIEDGHLHFRRLRWLDERYSQRTLADEQVPVGLL